MKIFPKVFKSNKTQKIYFQADAEYDAVEIKVQGMEYYTIGIPEINDAEHVMVEMDLYNAGNSIYG